MAFIADKCTVHFQIVFQYFWSQLLELLYLLLSALLPTIFSQVIFFSAAEDEFGIFQPLLEPYKDSYFLGFHKTKEILHFSRVYGMVGFPPWSSQHKHLEDNEAESAAGPLMEPLQCRITFSTWAASQLQSCHDKAG